MYTGFSRGHYEEDYKANWKGTKYMYMALAGLFVGLFFV